LSKDWFEKWFSDKFYLKLYQHRNDEDARDLINLVQRSIDVSTKCKALDIACGAGRHAIELSRRGFDVTGFDLSEFLIREAKRDAARAKEKNLKLKFLIKDMRDFNFKRSFDLALNIFTSFGYFDNDKENFSVIHNANRSLKPGGYLIFDFLNKDFLEKNIVPYSRKKSDEFVIIQKRKIENGFIQKEILIKNNGKEKRFNEILRLYDHNELRSAFKDNGFRIMNSFGDYWGNKFESEKSERLIFIAKAEK
jgi:SAM-dependent methyltransferase